ncbi:alkaline phosphatase family protein [Marinoscillum luteum]|uniref:Ectonucleotide pyrophosphatase/phosphodiesterase n=1 Tax=Marinoscillum luteum TaxID=861051 RepID=A0ABW7N884_9BACT
MKKSVLFVVSMLSTILLSRGQGMSYTDAQAQQEVIDRNNSDWAMQQGYVVLVGIDGFRYDYAQKYGAKHIQKLGQKGVKSERLLPSFPTKTFPNHYTIVTGLLPGNHGLVGNSFYSRAKQAWYHVWDREAVREASWYAGVPLWVLAEEQGMLSASFFWVGAESPIHGVKPTYNYAYDGSMPNEHRLRQVLDWLRLPDAKRPHMIAAYFSLVDDAGHKYGPDHPRTGEAVLKVDSLIGNFMDSLDQLGLPVHVVLVSDHGMSAISHGIVLSDVADLDDAQVSYSFPPMVYQPDSAKRLKLYDQLLRVPNMDVYTRENIPDFLSFSNDDRIGDFILMTDAPTIILEKPRPVSGGTHGFNPYSDGNMGAIFYAAGPKLKSGLEVPPVENIHIYPFIAELLGLTISEPIDGDLNALRILLKQD